MDYFQSRARPVSGSHPPNSKNSLEKRFVRKFISALALLVGAASALSAQSGTTISGTVTNEQGVPLPGATVLIQGTTTGAHTDDAGRYVIVVRNKTDLRLEVVLSVDGLGVLDGRKASVRKPGYIMAPRSELKVDGFRRSTESVAAFRFSPVRESYAAEKYHNTQNVGVIGVAVFNEAGTNPLTEREVQKRLNANPFPGRFAVPPQN